MKEIIFIFSIFCIFLLCGCEMRKSFICSSETLIPKVSMTTTIRDAIIESDDEDSDLDIDDILFPSYEEWFDTELALDDIYIPAKSWLISDEGIVQIISYMDYTEVISLDRTTIDRLEYVFLDTCVSVELFDETRQNISIMLSFSDGELLLDALKG